MEYASYSYLWPPRPDKAVAREMLGYYEQRGWQAQAKLNGSCSVVAISPDRRMVAMSRHKEPHKLWRPTPANVADFASLPGHGWYVFVAELMHAKVPGIRNVNYVHDILVADGRYLVGEAFAQRQDRLARLLKACRGKCAETVSHWELSPTLWLAKRHGGNLGSLFDRLTRPEHEGIVLKNPLAPLGLCLRQADNTNWQVKCRKPHKNYSF